MMPLKEVPPFEERSSCKNQSILISTDALHDSRRDRYQRGKGDPLDESAPNAGILTSKSQDLNLHRTHSGIVDEVSSNTQAISFENEADDGQSPTTKPAALGLQG